MIKASVLGWEATNNRARDGEALKRVNEGRLSGTALRALRIASASKRGTVVAPAKLFTTCFFSCGCTILPLPELWQYTMLAYLPYCKRWAVAHYLNIMIDEMVSKSPSKRSPQSNSRQLKTDG